MTSVNPVAENSRSTASDQVIPGFPVTFLENPNQNSPLLL
jgi:hypothetical protein